MNVALSLPWTNERFLDWAEVQNERYEFDGTAPVLMTGGNVRHGRMTWTLHAALRRRLEGTGLECHGPNLAVQTIGKAIRFPDALVTRSGLPDLDRMAPEVLSVFEVVSPTSGRLDRVTKRREYAAVPSVRSYIVIETASRRVTVLHRDAPDQDWSEAVQQAGAFALPELGISLEVVELYEGVTI